MNEDDIDGAGIIIGVTLGLALWAAIATVIFIVSA
jgi:hypothetical protein